MDTGKRIRKYMQETGRTQSYLGDLAPMLTDLRDALTKSREHAMLEYAKLQAFITEIEDSQTRLIFTLRYMDNLSWHQVAWRLGGNTPDSVRMIHNRFLARLEE